MAAPFGNENGRKSWFSPIGNEPTVKVQSKILKSQHDRLVALLVEGETESAFVRAAIANEIARRDSSSPV